MLAVLRKRIWALVIGSVCLVAVAAALATIMWNPREMDFMCHEVAFWGREDAPAVTLNGEPITCTEINQLIFNYGYLRVASTGSEVIGFLVSDALVRQEVDRRGLAVSELEVDTYAREQRSKCLGEAGAQCRAAILEDGLDPHDEDYWEIARPILQSDLERSKLDTLLIREKGLGQSGADEVKAALEAFYRQLEKDAEIVWHDESLELDYSERESWGLRPVRWCHGRPPC